MPQHHDQPPSGIRWFAACLAIFLGIALVIIDSTVVTVALPVMAESLGISDTTSIWLVNAYQVVLIAFLFPVISLARLVGRVRCFLAGILLFTIASLGCAVSGSFGVLLAFRMLQALGGAAMLSVNFSLVESVFPGPSRGRGIAINAAVISLSIIVAPALAGFILIHTSWPWLFAINLPLGAITLLAGRHIPRHGHTDGAGGAVHTAAGVALNLVIFAAAFMALCVICHGLPLRILPLSLALLLITVPMFRREQRACAEPVYPWRLLAVPGVSLTLACLIFSFMAQAGAVLAMPFLLMNSLGFDITSVSLLLICWPVAHIAASLLFGCFQQKLDAHRLCLAGILICAAGIGTIIAIGPAPGFADMAWRIALCGAGFGLFQAPNDTVSMAAAPPDMNEQASALLAFARTLGQTLGSLLTAAAFNLAPSSMTMPFALAALFALTGAFCIFRRRGGLTAGR